MVSQIITETFCLVLSLVIRIDDSIADKITPK